MRMILYECRGRLLSSNSLFVDYRTEQTLSANVWPNLIEPSNPEMKLHYLKSNALRFSTDYII